MLSKAAPKLPEIPNSKSPWGLSMKTKIIVLAISGLFLLMSCGGEEEQQPAAVVEEEVQTAASLLDVGQKKIDAGNLEDAVKTLNELLEEFPNADEAEKAKELITEAEEGLAAERMETERVQAKQVEELFEVKVNKVRTLIKGNKKYAYVKLNEKFPAIDIATKLGLM